MRRIIASGFGTDVSQENTYRRRLAEVLARRSDGLLLLTATPHDGHDAHFASLIALLDPSLVDGAGGFVGQDYRRHVIRRMKAHIRDPRTGTPLFRRRHVIPVKVDVAGAEHETSSRIPSGAVRVRRAPVAAATRSRQCAGFRQPPETVGFDHFGLSRDLARCCRTSLSHGRFRYKVGTRERTRVLRAWRRRVARFGSLSAADEANQEALEIESMAEALRLEPNSEPARLIALGIAADGQ
jgi:hypothetical protein